MARTHGNRLLLELFKELERLGFTVLHKKNGGFVISPPASNPNQRKYHTHGTIKALLPLRKDMKKFYGVDV